MSQSLTMEGSCHDVPLRCLPICYSARGRHDAGLLGRCQALMR